LFFFDPCLFFLIPICFVWSLVVFYIHFFYPLACCGHEAMKSKNKSCVFCFKCRQMHMLSWCTLLWLYRYVNPCVMCWLCAPLQAAFLRLFLLSWILKTLGLLSRSILYRFGLRIDAVCSMAKDC
jgi:hypothetical protein